MLDSPAFVLAGLSLGAWWPCAILASGLSIKFALKILSNVLLARGVWDTMFLGIGVHFWWVSSLTVASSICIDNDLSIESNWSWVLVIQFNVESVSKR